MNIRTRFAILSIITAIIAVSAVIYVFDGFIIPKQKTFSLQNAYSIALHVRRIVPLFTSEELQPMLESLSVENDSLSYIAIFDANNVSVANSDRGQINSTLTGYVEMLKSMEKDPLYRHTTRVQQKNSPYSKEPVYEIILPLYKKAAVVNGGVAVGVSVEYMKEIRQEYYEQMTVVLILLFATLFFVNWILYSSIIRPIAILAQFIKIKGFGKPVEFPSSERNDEIGTLIKALRTANVGVSDTISELKRREDELSEYTNSLPDIHAKLAPDGSIIMVNKAFLSMGEIPLELVIDQKFWEAPWCALTMDARIKIQDVVVRIGSGGQKESIEIESLGLSENRTIYLAFESVSDESGKVKCILVDGRDETERKLREMENLQKYLEEQKNRESDEEAKQEFYRDTMRSATGGKLRLVDHNDITGMITSVIAAFSLEKEEMLVGILNDLLPIIIEMGMSEKSAAEFILAVKEAMSNAVRHAGGGDLSVGVRSECVWVCIDDYGPGIDSLVLPAILLRPHGTAFISPGVGFSTMLEYADTLYISSDQNGTTVMLEKIIDRNSELPDDGGQ